MANLPEDCVKEMDHNLTVIIEECVEVIAQYLSLKEVIACSGVSSTWRSAFDKDRVWRRYHTVHRDYFHRQESQLGLTQEVWEGCEAKQHVFKELLVLDNIIQGNVHTRHMEVRVVRGTDTVDKAGNHLLFLLNRPMRGGDELQMWNLNGEPVLVSSYNSFKDRGPNLYFPRSMKAENGRLFLVYPHTVLAYSFCDRKGGLKFIFKVEIPKKTSVETRKTKFVFTSNKVVGFLNFNLPSPIFYVWDGKGALLCTSEPSVEMSRDFFRIYIADVFASYSTDSPNKIAVLSRWCNPFLPNVTTVLEIFNLITFQYTKVESKTTHPNEHIILNLVRNQIILQYTISESSYPFTKAIKLLDFNGTEILKMTLPKYEVQYFLPGGGGEIVIIEKSGAVSVLDVLKQNVVFMFSITCPFPTDGYVSTATTMKNSLLLVKWHKWSPGLDFIEVWNYKTGQRLSRLQTYPPTARWGRAPIIKSVNNKTVLPKVIGLYEQPSSPDTRQLLVASYW